MGKELSENKTELDSIVSEVREIGGLADADKLVTHIKELESLTKLMTVLTVRLKITESKMTMIKDETEKDFLQKKFKRLASQLKEAEDLKEFRSKRGETISKQLRSYLSIDQIELLSHVICLKENLESELCQLQEKIQFGEQQRGALIKTLVNNRNSSINQIIL